MDRRVKVLPPAKVMDRRNERRFVGSINGSYTLSRSRQSANGVEIYACRTQSISAFAAALTAPVIGEIGEALTVRLDGLGILRGEIARPLEDGFVFTLISSDAQRARLASKLAGLRRQTVIKVEDKRGHERYFPDDPRSVIALPDGSVLRCFVIDLSRSGAALSAACAPPLGSSLVVGKLACSVVRHLEIGFVVKFDAVQDDNTLEPLVTGYELHEEELA